MFRILGIVLESKLTKPSLFSDLFFFSLEIVIGPFHDFQIPGLGFLPKFVQGIGFSK